MKVEIVNWAKFNPRSDVKHPHWFRLQNTFLMDPDFFECTSNQKLVWIALLCEASRKQTGSISIAPDLIAALLRIDRDQVTESLSRFKSAGILKYTRNADVTSTVRPRTATEQDRTGQNRTTENVPSKTRRSLFKFEAGDLKAATWLRDEIAKLNPKARKLGNANLDAWANEFRMLREVDGFDMHEIVNVALWVLRPGQFWAGVIQSAGKLRECWDSITQQMSQAELKQRGNPSPWDIPDRPPPSPDDPVM